MVIGFGESYAQRARHLLKVEAVAEFGLGVHRAQDGAQGLGLARVRGGAVVGRGEERATTGQVVYSRLRCCVS